MLTIAGVAAIGRRQIAGVSVSPREKEIRWRIYQQILVKRSQQVGQPVIRDDCAGLNAAWIAVLDGTPWLRCQFPLEMRVSGTALKLTLPKSSGNILKRLLS